MGVTTSEAEILAAFREAAAKDPEIGHANWALANEAAEYAKSIAPVGDRAKGDPHPGRFRDSIHAQASSKRTSLPASKVVADDPTASFKEFGTSRTKEAAVFARTAAHFGWRTNKGQPVKGHIE